MVTSAAAAQLGAMAALVVLFVPMAMAGYHLSRNKMLFFSGALFITLAVFVHLAPYFPSLLSLSSTSPLPPPPPPLPLSCLHFLHSSLHFPNPSAFSFSTSSTSCHFQPISSSDASDLLNGSWILVAGDSQSRLFALSLLSLILKPESIPAVESALFRRHSDYSISIPESGIDLDFRWCPYESNITSLLRDLRAAPRAAPDLLIAGSGLWHMLHVANSSDYGTKLTQLRRSAIGLNSPHAFWIGIPTLLTPILNTEEKRARMNRTAREAYSRQSWATLRGATGGPFFYLDIAALSRRCGARCTEDGMHYDRVVYDAAVQIMLNALLVESRQRV